METRVAKIMEEIEEEEIEICGESIIENINGEPVATIYKLC